MPRSLAGRARPQPIAAACEASGWANSAQQRIHQSREIFEVKQAIATDGGYLSYGIEDYRSIASKSPKKCVRARGDWQDPEVRKWKRGHLTRVSLMPRLPRVRTNSSPGLSPISVV